MTSSVGKRHVRIWRLENGGQTTPCKRSEFSKSLNVNASPSKNWGYSTPSKMSTTPSNTVTPTQTSNRLVGKNCLLGDLLDNDFTSVTAISTDKAFLCTSQGDICLLNATGNSPELRKVASSGFGISASTLIQGESLLVAGEDGKTATFLVKNLEDYEYSHNAAPDLTDESIADDIRGIVGLGEQLALLSSEKGLTCFKVSNDAPASDLAGDCTLQLSAHNAPIVGLRAIRSKAVPNASFLTFSSDGNVVFWHFSGICVKRLHTLVTRRNSLEDGYVNELRDVVPISNDKSLAVVDKLGCLKCVHCPFTKASRLTSIQINLSRIGCDTS